MGQVTETIRYRYVGAGAFVHGVPARDLADADLADIDVPELEASGLYERADRGRAAASSKNEAAAAAKES